MYTPAPIHSLVCCNAITYFVQLVKRIFVRRMEDIVENDTKITHEDLANALEVSIEDPKQVTLIS